MYAEGLCHAYMAHDKLGCSNNRPFVLGSHMIFLLSKLLKKDKFEATGF